MVLWLILKQTILLTGKDGNNFVIIQLIVAVCQGTSLAGTTSPKTVTTIVF